MKTQQDYFTPFKKWSGSIWPLNEKQRQLAEYLHKQYGIPVAKALNLIWYVQDSSIYARMADQPNKRSGRSTFLFGLELFANNPKAIKEIIFVSENGSFPIQEPDIIEDIYSYLFGKHFFNYKTAYKPDNHKVRYSAPVIKSIATDVFKELTTVDKISKWKSQCIIGYIFALLKISLKEEEPIETEEEFNTKNKKLDLDRGPYSTYLTGRIKRYINN